MLPDVSTKSDEVGLIAKLLDSLWLAVTSGDSKFRPDKSAFALYEEYSKSGKTPDACVDNLVSWQMAKTATTGFVLGLPGLPALPATLPADLASTAYVQLRMIAVIGLLYGWDLKSDRLRTLAYLSLLGSSAGEALREAGVQVTTKLSASLIKKIPGKILSNINKFVGFRLLTKAGTTGVVNLTKVVPILGGVVGGGINAYSTKQISVAAIALLKDGPQGIDDVPCEESVEA